VLGKEALLLVNAIRDRAMLELGRAIYHATIDQHMVARKNIDAALVAASILAESDVYDVQPLSRALMDAVDALNNFIGD